ncbi:BEL1-like homeodomain protein 1 [Senna tora]|uniref:BEL1-like homeodomain protein 1 n=1 Tax=Senna tora TaxID=362788 RepID=A0A834SKK1_9FABA|nr:BEL1-like homeodomain protein 1 [Senna tora]
MATYFHGNSEIQTQAPDGLQTLVLMNPAYIHYSDTPHHHNPSNLLLLNSIAAANNNSHSLTSQALPHALPTHTQQFVGVPASHHDVSALHGRMHYNLWDPNAAARETPRASQQGLSLSLSSQQGGMGCGFRVEREVASSEGEEVGVSGGMQSVVVSSKYLKAAQEVLEEAVNVNNGIKTELGNKSTHSDTNKPIHGECSGTAPSGDAAESNAKPPSDLSPAERQEIQMKKAKLITMLDEVEQRYRQYRQQMQIVISSFEEAAGIGAARTYTALALKTISKQFRCLKDAITAQIRGANKSLGEEDCLAPKIEGSRLKYVDHQLRQQRALQHLGMIQHNAWRPQRGLPERSVSVLRAWLFEHFLHPYPKDSDKHMLAKQTGLTRSQVSNWFINARVRLWKPMVEEMYMEEMKEQEQNGSEDKSNKTTEDAATKTAAPQKRSSAATSQTDNAKTLNFKQDNNAPTVSVISSSPPAAAANVRNQFGFSFMGSSELEGITQASPKKPRNHEILHSPTSINMDVKPNNEGNINNEQMSVKFGDERQGRDGYSFMETQTNFMGGFGQYPIGEIGRFDAQQFTPRFSGNGVSLTLGLPHCDTLSGTHQTFLPNHNIQLGRRLEMGEANEFGGLNPSTPHSSAAAFENMNMQNPKRMIETKVDSRDCHISPSNLSATAFSPFIVTESIIGFVTLTNGSHNFTTSRRLAVGNITVPYPTASKTFDVTSIARNFISMISVVAISSSNLRSFNDGGGDDVAKRKADTKMLMIADWSTG